MFTICVNQIVGCISIRKISDYCHLILWIYDWIELLGSSWCRCGSNDEWIGAWCKYLIADVSSRHSCLKIDEYGGILVSKVGGVVVVYENSHKHVEEKTTQNDIVVLYLVRSQTLNLNQAGLRLINCKGFKRNTNVEICAREDNLEWVLLKESCVVLARIRQHTCVASAAVGISDILEECRPLLPELLGESHAL